MSSMTSATSTAGFSALLTAVRDVYSAEVYFQALPNLRFDQFATRKEEFGASPGSTLKMPKMGNVKRGGPLTEGVRMQTRAMTMSETSLTIGEQGNALAMTERLLLTSFYDNMAAASMLLGRDMAVVLDLQLRDAVLTGTNKVYGGGKAARTELVAGDIFDTQVIYDAVEQLQTRNVPKIQNDYYICFAHPHQLAKLRQTPGWINAHHYGAPGALFFGEVGRFEDVRFISTSVMPNGFNNAVNSFTNEYVDPGFSLPLRSGQSGNLTNIYQAVFFGEYSFGHAIGLPTELRDNGTQDFGREHALAWYAIWGSAKLENDNIVAVETA